MGKKIINIFFKIIGIFAMVPLVIIGWPLLAYKYLGDNDILDSGWSEWGAALFCGVIQFANGMYIIVLVSNFIGGLL